MQHLLQDVRYALRMLRTNVGLTTAVVLSLAIGIGANTAIFSVVNALLLRPLPYPGPDRLAILWLRSPGIGILQDWPSPGQYIDIKTENHSFQEMSISIGASMTLTGRDQPERLEALRTSSSLFSVLGAKTLLGRVLLPDEDKPGSPPVAVLNHAVWKRLFNSDPRIVGTSVVLNGNTFTIVGVMNHEFMLNKEIMPTVGAISAMDIFLPLPLGADAVNRRGDENYNLLARIKSGVTMTQAQSDIKLIGDRIREKDKRDRTFAISVVPLLEQVIGNVRPALLVLLGSVALVLLIACANVANLLLSRAARRRKEVAIRTALGAGWQRLLTQLLTESVLLGVAGGAAGLLIAEWSLHVARVMHPGNIPRMAEIGIDGRVLLFTFVISILTGIVFGIAPALQAAKVDLNTSLKAGGRSSQGDGSGLSVSQHRLRGLLVVSELALSLMLLIAAGLLLRSFARLQAVPPGFNPDHALSMMVQTGGPAYRPPQARVQFFKTVRERIANVPGVKAVGGVTTLPFAPGLGWGGINVEGFTPLPGQELQVDQRIATVDYFRAMEIPLRQGRFFEDRDTPDSPLVALIDEKFAQRFWPHESAINKHLWFDVKKPMTIVGVVGTVKQYGLDIDGKIVVYLPHAQNAAGRMYMVARTSSDPSSMAGAMAREIHAVDRDVSIYQVRSMEERLSDSLARQRFSTTMLGAFALFALVLAIVGVYGVMSYLVTQGTHDFGVRIALGAQRSNILRMVVGRGMQLAAIGVGAGLLGAVALTRVMSSLLFGTTATDPVTFSAVSVVLLAIALLATYIPARRATRVDPMVALREE